MPPENRRPPGWSYHLGPESYSLRQSSEVGSSEEDSDTDTTDDGELPIGPSKSTELTLAEELDDVLTKIKTIPFINMPDSIKARLSRRVEEQQPTALHILAGMNKDKLPPEKMLKPLVEHLVRSPNRLMEVVDDSAGYTPLHTAINKSKTQNRSLIRWMCQANDIDVILAIKSHRLTNCLHLAVERGGKTAQSLVNLASPETICARNKDGNTALHLAVEFARCVPGQLALVQSMLEKCDEYMKEHNVDFNYAGRSPYLHHLYTRDESNKVLRTTPIGGRVMDARKLPVADPDAEMTTTGATREHKRASVTQTQPSVEEDPMQNRKVKRQPTQNISTRALIESPTNAGSGTLEASTKPTDSLVVTTASSVVMNGVSDRLETPTSHPRPPKEVHARGGSSGPDFSASAADVRDFLKLHYLRTRKDDAAFEIMYGFNPAPETMDLNIYFDLSGYEQMNLQDMKCIARTLAFDDVLQYVDIPKIRKPEGQTKPSSTLPRLKGRDDLVSVFKLLKGVGVIVEVKVNDLETPAHSDVAIEAALKGKRVEIWDWRKLDLCSEVIRKTAPAVKMLKLYWSGNNAVLRAWSEKSGLPQLSELQQVHVHFLNDAHEPIDRIIECEKEFKERMTEQVKRQRFKAQARLFSFDFARNLGAELLKQAENPRELPNEKRPVVYEIAKQFAAKSSSFRNDLSKNDFATAMYRVLVDELRTSNLEKHKLSTAPEANASSKATCIEMAKWLLGILCDRNLSPGKDSDWGLLFDAVLSDLTTNATERISQLGSQFFGKVGETIKDVDIKVIRPDSDRPAAFSNTSYHTANDSKDPDRHEWIDCMAGFKKLLLNAENNHSTNGPQKIADLIQTRGETIRVALIDDGVNIQELHTENSGKMRGRSFGHRNGRTPPFYTSSGGHGTIMASQILRICPRAKIDVLKLEDYMDEESKERRITMKSAAQAIAFAVRMKVHVISMSWTIPVPTNEKPSQDMLDLEAAVMDAAREGILMFCSASDEGAKQSSTYPSKATSSIFRIGGADANGGLYKPVGDLNAVDFILPGKLVKGEELEENADNQVQYMTGSSVATALAAGLAALILYCAQLKIAVASSPAQQAKRKAQFQMLKNHDKMMEAFKAIGTTEASKFRYLKVWDVFGQKVQTFHATNGDYTTALPVVANTVDILCAKMWSSGSVEEDMRR